MSDLVLSPHLQVLNVPFTDPLSTAAPMSTERCPLGASDIQLSPIGLGCWQFSEGKGLIGGFWETLPRDDVREIVRVSTEEGINWFDTAEPPQDHRGPPAEPLPLCYRPPPGP